MFFFQFFWYVWIPSTMFWILNSSLYRHLFADIILYILVMALKSHLCCFQTLSVLFSTHVSLPYLRAVFAVTACILSFVSLHFFFYQNVFIIPLILLFFFNLYSMSILYSEILFPRYSSSVTYSMILPCIIVFSLHISLPHISMDFVFEMDIFKLYFLAILFN
jgi:hypothetical protein